MLFKDISKIGLGTWGLGGNVTPDLDNNDIEDICAIQFAIEHGINHLDTSESYAGGKSEILVGKAIQRYRRSDIMVATKVREWNLSFSSLLNSCYRSLERLKTSYIDLYYIHKQNSDIPVPEVCKGLNRLYAEGVIKNIGLSNVCIDTINLYNRYLDVKVAAVQNQYSLICRESQKTGVVDYCRQNGILFISWRPILMSFPGAVDPRCRLGTYPLLDEIAKKYGVTNVQILAKWILHQENVYLIFKSNKINHIAEIIDTQQFDLSESDWEKLNVNFPVQFNKGCSTNEFYRLS